MWALPVGVPTGPEYDSVPVSDVDPGYGLEPVGAPGCDLCAAWLAEREVARQDREHRRVRQADAELGRHPGHQGWPGGEVFR
ncbi:hypothetical protein [Streptomyces sp. BPTC-684]|uniref:hypothetical protein n=1 Tax=Streptomyces sp. BPTC-684 TaxID=3043734 RepID=UPI0024B1A595|nr:hypothetical protein [Streptomyces sp. BPTC-684]WHM37442.1 hypothetical protein QIY60_11350 [Streptomyces sp. BPTC-684]